MLTFTIKRNWFEMIASGEKKRGIPRSQWLL